MLKRLSLAAATAALLAACGGGSSHSGPNIACNFASDSECDEVTGPQAALDLLHYTAAGCAAASGVVVSSCPSAGRVGRCSQTQTSGGTSVTMVGHFYAPAWDAATVQTQCAGAGGTFQNARLVPAAGWGSGAVSEDASFEAQ